MLDTPAILMLESRLRASTQANEIELKIVPSGRLPFI